MKAIWQDIEVNLIQPLLRDTGEKISQLTFCMIDRGQHRAVIEANDDDRETIYRELIKLGAKLTDKEMARLTAPDYNSLLQTADSAYGEGSDYWFEKLVFEPLQNPAEEKTMRAGYQNINKMPLLIPIDTATHGLIDCINLQFPTVGALDMMRQQPEDQQDEFIQMHCTSLGTDELDSLSVPDGKSLAMKVADFLSKTGSFYLEQMTSKN